MTSRLAIAGFAIALALAAAAVFAGVAIHELQYASDHPYHYGPAKVIAWCSAGGVVLSVAVGLVGYCLMRRPARSVT
jgi:zinc transporter ZupT